MNTLYFLTFIKGKSTKNDSFEPLDYLEDKFG
ncbi:hypothetical protein SAMN06298216_0316 [Spirosomataceae bacterium TFI 002]|nr:hypothetical protein SAMN06298216_0316 [Spirosomataceae bacterium TFI 002]